MVNCGLITQRDRSRVWHVKIDGKDYCWKILSDDERFSYTYERAYENYRDLKMFRYGFLVDVVSTWRGDEGEFNVLMEWLDGYTRLEYKDHDPRIVNIEKILIEHGYFVIDFAPINFMVKGKDIKMIDLDTLAKLSDFPVDAHAPIPELSWYGSRVLKQKSGRVS